MISRKAFRTFQSEKRTFYKEKTENARKRSSPSQKKLLRQEPATLIPLNVFQRLFLSEDMSVIGKNVGF